MTTHGGFDLIDDLVGAARVGASNAQVVDPNGEAELARAHDRFEAAGVVCDWIHRHDGLLPSVYVVRDGLLRCIGQRGYWQVLDGLPLGVGVLSSAVLDGVVVEIDHVGECEEFLEATPGLEAEIAVPLWAGGRVVGGLNVEARRPITAGERAEIIGWAASLQRALAEVGVEDPESPLARLARTSKQLAGLTEVDDVRRVVVDVACEVAPMDSACLVERDDRGRLVVTAAAGRLAPTLRSVPACDLEELATAVDRVSSCYSAGEPKGAATTGTATLRASGVTGAAVIPLTSLGRCVGLLVAATDGPVRLVTDHIEPLELLAGEAARCLDLAAKVAELRRVARCDPLTQLQSHSAFYEALDNMAEPYALVVMDLDDFKPVNDRAGHLAGDELLRCVAKVIKGALGSHGHGYRIGGDEFAAIMPMGDVATIASIVRDLLDRTDAILVPHQSSISAGLTLSRPHERSRDVFDRADQLLYTAKRNGGRRLQSDVA